MPAPIFGPYDQGALDAQYNNRARVPDFKEHLEKWAAWSAEARDRYEHCRIDVSYGASGAEKLDIFPAPQTQAPVCMFIHGGYWQLFDKSDFSFVARGLTAHGVTCVVNNYALCPKVAMDEITRQNRAALAWLWHNAADIGIDRDRMHVSGHSAGGQLVAMLLATDWPRFCPGAPADLIKSGFAISGLYDMEPIRLCYLNEVLRMDEASCRRNNPLAQTYPAGAPLLVAVGGLESDEYHRQAHAMTSLWERLGHPVEEIVRDDLNHFSIVEELADPASPLVQKQRRMI